MISDRRTAGVFLILLTIGSSAALADERLDRYGDPLPEGALARLGTERYRHGLSGVDLQVQFLPGTELLVVGGEGAPVLMDARSGRVIRRISEAAREFAVASSAAVVATLHWDGGPDIYRSRILVHELITDRLLGTIEVLAPMRPNSPSTASGC